MLRHFYSASFSVFLALAAPFYFRKMWRRGGWRRGFAERFGFYGSKLSPCKTRSTLWFHAVSVGEASTCSELILKLEEKVSNCHIVASTTTTTGMAVLQRKLPERITKVYYPVDTRSAVKRTLDAAHPSCIILFEAELWPNFLWEAQAKRIPIFLVNARISEKSYQRYKLFSFLFRPIFAGFTGVGCQNDLDAKLLCELGFPSKSIRSMGNMKFDTAGQGTSSDFDAGKLLQNIGVPSDAPVVVGGSTHEGEEALLARICQRLRRRFASLFLILVPRHFERCSAVAKELSKLNVKFVRRTEAGGMLFKKGEVNCLLVDTTGELKSFYRVASIVFVGKSLTASGGQNPIEPAGLGKAVIMGPNMQNFRAIANELLANGGAVRVKDQEELENTIEALLVDYSRRRQLGDNALRTVQANLGATQRTAEFILHAAEMQRLAAGLSDSVSRQSHEREVEG